jgi:hypothetical protein
MLFEWIVAAAAVVAGDGGRAGQNDGGACLLRRVPEARFRTVVSGLLLALGTWMVFHG